MTTHNTGNPVPSTAVKDLYDNAENLDIAMNTDYLAWPDRLGKWRPTFAGLEKRVNDMLAGMGLSYAGAYAPGLVISSHSQWIEVETGDAWVLSASVPVPYAVTGDWDTDKVNFQPVPDLSLRGELSSNDLDKGAAGVKRAIQSVENIAQLRQLSKNSASIYAETFGYHDKGDGGGGLYYLDETDGTSADNGVTVIVAADGGRWKLNHKGVIYAKSAGAAGDGEADDTLALRRFFSAISSNMRAVINPGAYLISRDAHAVAPNPFIPSCVLSLSGVSNFSIDGFGARVIQPEKSQNAVALGISDCHNFTISGLTLDGENHYTTSSPLNYTQFLCAIVACTNYRVDKNTFENSSNVGLLVTHEYSSSISNLANHDIVRITNNTFKNCFQNSTYGAGVGDLVLSGNTFLDMMGASFKLSSASGAVSGFNSVLITNNTISTTDEYVNPRNATNTAQNDYFTGFDGVSCAKNVIYSNNIIDIEGRGPSFIGYKINWAEEFGDVNNIGYQNRNISISGGIIANLPSLSTAISACPYIDNFTVGGVTFDKAVTALQIAPIGKALTAFDGKTTYTFKGNTILDGTRADVVVSGANFSRLEISDNSSDFQDNSSTLQFLASDTTSAVKTLVIKGNTTAKGITWSAVATKAIVSDNTVNAAPGQTNTISINNALLASGSSVELKDNNVYGGTRVLLRNFERGAVVGLTSHDASDSTAAVQVSSVIDLFVDANSVVGNIGACFLFANNTDAYGHVSGIGAPSYSMRSGSRYSRLDGSGASDNLYIRRGGSWVGIA